MVYITERKHSNQVGNRVKPLDNHMPLRTRRRYKNHALGKESTEDKSNNSNNIEQGTQA